MKKIQIFKKYDDYKEIIFAAVTVVTLFVAAFLWFTIERELYQLIALFCVLVVSVLVFAVFNLFHGMRAAIAAFVAFEMMLSALLWCAVSPAFLTAIASSTLYDSPVIEREIFKDKNVVIFVPHEDDELNILAGVIEEYVSAGSKVKLVYMTYGDYWGNQADRVKEGRDVAAFYGLDYSDVIFFGYGDQWQGTHIYNMERDQIATSHLGKTATYDVGEVSPYRHEDYTHNNLLNDFKSVILEYMPDTMFVVDYDHHSDHRANGLFFDEALSEVLSETSGYYPAVYKAFSYVTAWESVKDFYDGENIISTLSPTASTYIENVNCYLWADRVRMPMAVGSIGYLLHGSPVYEAYRLPVSQNSYMQAIRAVNSDKVYFRRDTSSLTYKAEITVSSNKDIAYKLSDFKLLDSEDVTVEYGNDFYAGTWYPSSSDSQKEVTVKFASSTSLSMIRLYDSVSLSDNVLKGSITLSDGTVIPFENLAKNGSATDITFEKKNNISGFTVKIEEYSGEKAGFSEIEAYSEAPDYSSDAFVKIVDSSDNFIYEYTAASDESYFSLYAYECSSDVADYDISAEGDITASVEDGKIKVVCGVNSEGILTVKNKKSGVTDSVRITNPNFIVRAWRGFLKHTERNYSFEERSIYYSNLVSFVQKKLS